MATPAKSACNYLWRLALLTHLFVCRGTDCIEWSFSFNRFSTEAAQHYFAMGAHLLNAYCVLLSELRLLRDTEKIEILMIEMLMLLIPQGENLYKWSSWYSTLPCGFLSRTILLRTKILLKTKMWSRRVRVHGGCEFWERFSNCYWLGLVRSWFHTWRRKKGLGVRWVCKWISVAAYGTDLGNSHLLWLL